MAAKIIFRGSAFESLVYYLYQSIYTSQYEFEFRKKNEVDWIDAIDAGFIMAKLCKCD
jgi:hypothetical protein